MYPKIFQRIIPRDLRRSKKSATSHSTNWGKRSTETNPLHIPSTKYAKQMQKFQIPWKIIQRGLKRREKEVAKRMWVPDQEVHQPAARRQPLEKNGNEKEEGRPTAVVSSRMLKQFYKRPRQRKQRVTLSLDILIRG